MAGIDSEADATATSDGIDLSRWVMALLPIVLLVVLLGMVVAFPLFSGVQSGEPLPDVSVSHVTLPNDETLVLHVTNNGPQEVTISQVLVDEAYWSFGANGGGAGAVTLAPLQSTAIEVPYHWTPGWDLGVALVLDSGATFHHTIVAPQPAPGVGMGILGTLALVGLLVGVIPVALGMLWLPVMDDLDDRWLHAILAFAAGILAFLAFDAGFESLELAELVPGAYEGTLLVVTGAIGTMLLVQGVSDYFTSGDDVSGLALAYMVALGIGLHNLAEGLAIGSSFAQGRVSLGAFLVIGFMIHNVTEGPAVVAPVARKGRPALWHFAALGLLAGAPVILGGWIGSYAYSPTLGALFLAIGVGAILQVDWEIAQMIRRDGRLGSAATVVAFLVGLVVMYATDLLVAL
ncbi:ZIP family metal transporter [Halobacteriales archaeon Cl-PHB]